MKWIAGSLMAGIFLAGCASTGEIGETKKFSGNFDSHKKVSIQALPNATVKQDETQRVIFSKILAKEIAKIDLFDEVQIDKSGKAAGLLLKTKFVKIEEPSDAATMFGGGMANSEVFLEVGIFETQPKLQALASLSVTGNSKMKGRSSVGGIGVTDSNALTHAAMIEAAERIANYLKDHSRKRKSE
jgi:hypothetical protein